MSEVQAPQSTVVVETTEVAEVLATSTSQDVAVPEQQEMDANAAPATEELAPPLAKVEPEEPVTTATEAEVGEPSTTATELEPEVPTVSVDETRPIYVGSMHYKRASAALPISHKRFFHFSKEPVPAIRLQALYEKYKKLKFDKEELNHLIAHAATSGVGLFYFSKHAKMEPSGILECSRMTEIRIDDHVHERFTIMYDGKAHAYHFECAQTDRESWIRGIMKMKTEGALELDAIRSSPKYTEMLQKLQDGTAFTKEVFSHEVLTDDENVASAENTAETVETPAAETDRVESAKNKRASGFLSSFKDKLPVDKAVEEVAEQTVESTEKTAKKEKRKSFLASFMAKKDLPTPKSEQIVESEQVAPADTEAVDAPVATESLESVPGESVSTEAMVVLPTPEAEAEIKKESSKQPKTPLKDKVDGFFSMVKKLGDRESRTPSPGRETAPSVKAETVGEHSTSSAPEVTEEVQNDSTKAETAPEAMTQTSGSETVMTPQDNTMATDENRGQTVIADHLKSLPGGVVSAEVVNATAVLEKKAGNLGRRLTGLFRGRKSTKTQTTGPVTSPEPPQLPETATVEAESQGNLENAVEKAAEPIISQIEEKPLPEVTETVLAEKSVNVISTTPATVTAIA